MQSEPTPEQVEAELRAPKMGSAEELAITLDDLCIVAADTIASLRAALAERDAEVERLRAELNAEKSDAIAARAQVRKLLAQVAAEREACAVTVDGWLHPGFAAQQVGELNSDQQAAVFVVLKAVARAIRERKP